jgi:hypothetical protein
MGGFWRIFRRIGAASAITAGSVLLVALLAVSGTAVGALSGEGYAAPARSDTWISQAGGVPFAYAASREEPKAPCAPLRHVARTLELPLPFPDAEADAIRSPQQFAHVCADSRSPPLI